MADFNNVPSEPVPTGCAAGGRILLVDDDDLLRQSVARMLWRAGHEVTAVSDGPDALERVTSGRFDLVLGDFRMSRAAGLELVSAARQTRTELPVVLMLADASVRTAVEAMRRGAYDYIQKPFDREDLLIHVQRALDHARTRQQNVALREAAGLSSPPQRLIGSGQAMREVNTQIARLAPVTTPVLIRGDRGTGKKVAARLIHAHGCRASGPMVSVNCADAREQQGETDLFGPTGRLEMADRGTILLEEIWALPRKSQGRLLRVLEEQERGESPMVRVDVRILATSSRRLSLAVARGEFREDLYHRLTAGSFEMPPLRERREDIPELVSHFLHRIARREGGVFRHVEPAALRMLQKYPWPGNVRELQHLVERAAAVEPEPGLVRAATVGPWLSGGTMSQEQKSAGRDPLDHLPLAEVERRVILETLAKFEGHRARTAGALGIGVRTLGIKLKKWREDGQLGETNGNRRYSDA